MSILRIENLSKYYTSQSSVVLGLSNINLSFDIGEFVAITGESGSGKSTLAHVLGGLLQYESGELYVYGKPTSHYDSGDWERYRRDLVGFISQSYGILPGNTVLENVESALRFSGIEKEKATEGAKEILLEVGLWEFRNRRADKLSSGQKQRLSIARALAKPSKILIADEPTGNLDAENSNKIIELLKNASKDRLVILITHDFDEAKDFVTRRIVLSDSSVVTDTRMNEGKNAENNTIKAKKADKPLPKLKDLVPYVSCLTLKSRPVFSIIVCLFLAFTSFITFAFLGTFTVALDDSNTKIYKSDAFLNGSADRIVVMKANGEDFTEEDYRKILSAKYVNDIEKWGYAHDFNYYYQNGKDHRVYNEVMTGPNYNPYDNPEDKYVVETLEFYDDSHYVRSVPVTNSDFLSKGQLPLGVYEVVSGDSSLKVGDTVKVYIRNRAEWSGTAYIAMIFTVTGETNQGKGLYFSDKLVSILSSNSGNNPEGNRITVNTEKILLAPYVDGSFTVSEYNGNKDAINIAEDQILFTSFMLERLKLDLSKVYKVSCYIRVPSESSSEKVTAVGTFVATYSRLALVNSETFEKYLDTTPDNQISVYIKDYAYADRVMRALGDMGYISSSPFRLGATVTDSQLATERMITLSVCLGAFVLIIVLQMILIKALFSSLNDHFALMSNIGLTADVSYLSLMLMMGAFTLVGEALGAGIILLLNGLQVEKIYNIFKYMEWHNILLLFAVHLGSVCFAFVSVLKNMKKNVFYTDKQMSDIDFTSALEEEES